MWEAIGIVATILGTIITIVSLVFAVYVYLKARQERITEKMKNVLYKERLRNLTKAVKSASHTVDGVVQIGKRDDATVEQLQDIARVARAELEGVLQMIDAQRQSVEEWKFGKVIESEPEVADMTVSDNTNIKAERTT